MSSDGFRDNRQKHSFNVDQRYVGQSFTISVPCNPKTVEWNKLRDLFHKNHEQTFGRADLESEVELVNIRLTSFGLINKPNLKFTPDVQENPIIDTRPVWFATGWNNCPVLNRKRMQVNSSFEGPMIIEEEGGTSVIPPDWTVNVAPSRSLNCHRNDGV